MLFALLGAGAKQRCKLCRRGDDRGATEVSSEL